MNVVRQSMEDPELGLVVRLANFLCIKKKKKRNDKRSIYKYCKTQLIRTITTIEHN